MTDNTAIPPLPPDAFGDYRVTRALRPGASFLALAPSGRKVVLKPLDDDCLLKGRLHPNIRDRLDRVRQLAHVGVANLHAVEKLDGRAFLVWEYVEGGTFDECVDALASPDELAVLARELFLTIEALHAQGVVHGQILPGNVIIDPLGRVKLTHVSPLLYEEIANDVHDALAMLSDVVRRRGWAEHPVGTTLARAAAKGWPPAQIRYRLGTGPASAPPSDTSQELAPGPRSDRPLRRRAVMTAGATAAFGTALALGVLWTQSRHATNHLVPPEASPDAVVGDSR